MRFSSQVSYLTVAVLLVLLVACDNTQSGLRRPSPAETLSISPSFLSFDGTSTATVDVTADGTWSLETNQEWITVDESSGSGDETITITIDRSGVSPGHYAGTVLFRGTEPLATVTVSMRFPEVGGTVSDSGGQVTAAADPLAAPEIAHPFVPGEVLVRLDEGMARVLAGGEAGLQPRALELTLPVLDGIAADLAADYGLTSAGVASTALPVALLRTGGSVQETIAGLLSDGRVASAQPNYLYQVPGVEPQGLETQEAPFDLQWHYANVNMAGAWSIGLGSSDVTVAVIDSGYATQHPDLSPNLLDGYDFGEDDGDERASTQACALHGTHVAGTVGAVANDSIGVSGVAPNVSVLPLKVGADDGAGNCPLSTGGLYRAILYAAGFEDGGAGTVQPVDVINMSLGGPAYDFVMGEVVALALGQGVVVVAAAGNEFGAPVAYPAAFPGVVGVSATDYNDVLTAYSNVGIEIDVAAPGGDLNTDLNGDGFPDGVLSTGWDFTVDGPDYYFLDGTSMASPHVAGIVALMRSVNRDLTPTEVIVLLWDSSRDLGASGFDTSYGAGIVDAGAAVQAARDALTATFPEVIVRLSRDDVPVAQTRAGAGGAFKLEGVGDGSYLLEAGTDVDGDGVLSEPGEFYSSTSISVSYDGDITRNLDLDPN